MLIIIGDAQQKRQHILLLKVKIGQKAFACKKWRFVHDSVYALSNEPRFWFNALTNLHFTEYIFKYHTELICIEKYIYCTICTIYFMIVTATELL